MRAPACAGDASVFSFKSPVCTGCAVFNSCAILCREALERLEAGSAGLVLIQQHQRYEAAHAQASSESVAVALGQKRNLTEQEEAIAQSLPVKVAPQYRRIVAEGYLPLMKQGVANASNPFAVSGYKYLHVAFAALLDGGFTKKALRERYMQECGWSEGTAFSAVSMIWHLFPVCGIALEAAGVLSPITTDYHQNQAIKGEKQ